MPYLSQILYPHDLCNITEDSYIVGWNLEGFRCCIVCTIPIVNITHVRLQNAIQNSSKSLNHVFQECSLSGRETPTILGILIVNKIHSDTVYSSSGILELQNHSGLWIVLKSKLNHDNSIHTSLPTPYNYHSNHNISPIYSQVPVLEGLYSSGCLYDTTCYMTQYYRKNPTYYLSCYDLNRNTLSTSSSSSLLSVSTVSYTQSDSYLSKTKVSTSSPSLSTSIYNSSGDKHGIDTHIDNHSIKMIDFDSGTDIMNMNHFTTHSEAEKTLSGLSYIIAQINCSYELCSYLYYYLDHEIIMVHSMSHISCQPHYSLSFLISIHAKIYHTFQHYYSRITGRYCLTVKVANMQYFMNVLCSGLSTCNRYRLLWFLFLSQYWSQHLSSIVYKCTIVFDSNFQNVKSLYLDAYSAILLTISYMLIQGMIICTYLMMKFFDYIRYILHIKILYPHKNDTNITMGIRQKLSKTSKGNNNSPWSFLFTSARNIALGASTTYSAYVHNKVINHAYVWRHIYLYELTFTTMKIKQRLQTLYTIFQYASMYICLHNHSIVSRKHIWRTITTDMTCIFIDILLGLCIYYVISHYMTSILSSIYHSASYFEQHILFDTLKWFTKAPLGIKLSVLITNKIGSTLRFIFTTIHKVYTYLYRHHLIEICCRFITLFGIFGLSIQCYVILDIIRLCTSYIRLIHRLFALQHKYQISLIISLWYLFHGRKWNILRKRVDSSIYDQSQLLFGTILFVVNIFFLPSFAIYYYFFTCIHMGIVCLQVFLWGICIGLKDFPYYRLYTFFTYYEDWNENIQLKIQTSSSSSCPNQSSYNHQDYSIDILSNQHPSITTTTATNEAINESYTLNNVDKHSDMRLPSVVNTTSHASNSTLKSKPNILKWHQISKISHPFSPKKSFSLSNSHSHHLIPVPVTTSTTRTSTSTSTTTANGYPSWMRSKQSSNNTPYKKSPLSHQPHHIFKSTLNSSSCNSSIHDKHTLFPHKKDHTRHHHQFTYKRHFLQSPLEIVYEDDIDSTTEDEGNDVIEDVNHLSSDHVTFQNDVTFQKDVTLPEDVIMNNGTYTYHEKDINMVTLSERDSNSNVHVYQDVHKDSQTDNIKQKVNVYSTIMKTNGNTDNYYEKDTQTIHSIHNNHIHDNNYNANSVDDDEYDENKGDGFVTEDHMNDKIYTESDTELDTESDTELDTESDTELDTESDTDIDVDIDETINTALHHNTTTIDNQDAIRKNIYSSTQPNKYSHTYISSRRINPSVKSSSSSSSSSSSLLFKNISNSTSTSASSRLNSITTLASNLTSTTTNMINANITYLILDEMPISCLSVFRNAYSYNWKYFLNHYDIFTQYIYSISMNDPSLDTLLLQASADLYEIRYTTITHDYFMLLNILSNTYMTPSLRPTNPQTNDDEDRNEDNRHLATNINNDIKNCWYNDKRLNNKLKEEEKYLNHSPLIMNIRQNHVWYILHYHSKLYHRFWSSSRRQQTNKSNNGYKYLHGNTDVKLPNHIQVHIKFSELFYIRTLILFSCQFMLLLFGVYVFLRTIVGVTTPYYTTVTSSTTTVTTTTSSMSSTGILNNTNSSSSSGSDTVLRTLMNILSSVTIIISDKFLISKVKN